MFDSYLRTLRRSWPFVVVLPLIGAMIGLGVSRLTAPVYEATASVYVTIDTVGGVVSSLTAQQRMDGFAALASSTAVLEAAAAAIGAQDGRLDGISAAVTPATTTLVVTAEADGPQEAALAADTVAKVTAQEIEERGSSEVLVAATKKGGKMAKVIVNAEVVAPSGGNARLVSPRRGLNTALGFLLGLFIGVAGPLAREALNPRIRDPKDLDGLSDVPYLGRIRTKASENHESAQVDFALVNAALRARTDSEDTRSIVLIPVTEASAMSTVAMGLACDSSQEESPVAVVWLDETQDDESEPPGVVDQVTLPPGVGPAMSLREMRRVLDEQTMRYRRVIISSSTSSDSPEALLLASAADGAVLLVADRTPVKAVCEAVSGLHRTGSTLLGVVLV